MLGCSYLETGFRREELKFTHTLSGDVFPGPEEMLRSKPLDTEMPPGYELPKSASEVIEPSPAGSREKLASHRLKQVSVSWNSRGSQVAV